MDILLDVGPDGFKFLCLVFQVLPVGSLQGFNLGDHVVALLHSFVDQIYFVVDKSRVVFNLFFEKSESLLLGLELVLDFFEDAFFEYFRVVGGHSHDVVDAVV